MITIIIFAGCGFVLGFIIIILIKSIYMPGPRMIQAIMKFGKLHTFISNVEGKRIYEGEMTHAQGLTKWDLIDSDLKRLNIYFFLWPIYTLYTYPLTYTKSKKIGEEQPGDVIIYTDQKTKDIWVSRTGISDHLEFREEYPTVSLNLVTKELATVTIYTNNMIEVTNPALALFGIKNWFIAGTEILTGAQRGLVASKRLYDLNQFSSEGGESLFSEEMKKSVNKKDKTHPRLENFGLKLYKSVFKDFDPANELAQKLMDSFAEVTIAEQTGKAKVVMAKNDAEVKTTLATATATAYATEQEAIVKWKKKFLVDTGLAKVDAEGNIIELVPDANTKAYADAIAEWSKTTGTLAIGGDFTKILSLNNKPNKED